LLGHILASAFVVQGRFFAAGIVLLVFAPFDAIDGSMARLSGTASKLGAYVDSVVDRYAELVLFAGLLIYYAKADEQLMQLLVFGAAAGSVLVSYTRARAEGLGFEIRIGLATRLERYLILIPSLLLGFPHIGVGLVAILANFTALQRILEVRKLSRNHKLEGDIQ
jgi:CDP-diacylglycerol--glycerol-3-phosphate 3-phosphatidyltransferase